MKDELNVYAMSFAKIGLEKLPAYGFWIGFSLCHFCALTANIPWGIISGCFFFAIYIFMRKEPDIYRKQLLRIGLFLLSTGLDLIVISAYLYNALIPHLIALVITIISYEIMFLVKIRKKAYSNKSPRRSTWIDSIPLTLAISLGFRMGSSFTRSPFVLGDIKLWFCNLAMCFVIMYAVIYFQKFFILKFSK